MMTTSLVWIYACRLEKTPSRRHAVKGRDHFAFSDVRKLVAQAALDENFPLLCPVPRKPALNILAADQISPLVKAMMSSVDIGIVARPRILSIIFFPYSLLPVSFCKITTLPCTTNSTSEFGKNPIFSRTSMGIVTCPLLVIFIRFTSTKYYFSKYYL